MYSLLRNLGLKFLFNFLFFILFFLCKSFAQFQSAVPKIQILKDTSGIIYFQLPLKNQRFVEQKHQRDSSNFMESIKELEVSFRNIQFFRTSSFNNKSSYIVQGAFKLNIDTTGGSCNYGNGSIIVSASGGTAPYLYTYTYMGVFTQSQNTGNFQNLQGGPYVITVTDATGKEVITNVNLPNTYEAPQVDISSSVSPSGCDTYDGSVTVTGSHGTPPYQYSLDGVHYQSSNVFSNLAGGFYYLSVRDANSCVYFEPGGIGFFFSSNSNCTYAGGSFSIYTCNNNGNISFQTPQLGSPPYQFSLDGKNYQSDCIFNNVGQGFNHVYIRNSVGQVTIETITMMPWCQLEIKYVIVDAECKQSDGSLTVNVVNGTGPYSYTLDGIHYQTSNTFTGLSCGNYTVTVKDASGSMTSDFITISNRCPSVTATQTDETCGNKNGTITATGNKGTQPYQFSLDGINFQADNIFSGLSAGNYTVTIKDAGGFISSTDATIKNNCLQLSLNVINTTCSNKNGSITATASNGSTPFQYSIDGINFQTGNLFDSLTKGDYTITVKDGNGLTKDSAIMIKDAPAPLIDVTVLPTTCTNTNGLINITASGGSNPIEYSVDNGISFKTSNAFTSLDSGKYIAVVKDANGCTNKDTIQVTTPPSPNVFLGNDTSLCDGQNLLISTGFSATYKYLWQDNSTGYNYVVKQPGSYFVNVTNQFNCSASDTINIKYKSLPVFDLGNDTSLCNGQTLLLKPSSFVAGSFLWNTGSTSTALNVNSAGLYWLQVSDSGCAKRDSVLITYHPNPIIDLGNDTTICEGKTLTLNATNSKATYFWQDGSALPLFIVNSPGGYSVKVDLNGCDTTAKINVSYITKPSVQLGPDTALCVNENLLLNAYYPGASYLWQDGSASPQFNVTKEGTYSVSVTNTCGAVNSSINVLYKNCACKFYIPSAFTPNNDGKNDMFRTLYSCFFSSYEMRVFNRFGQQVFFSNSASIGWDGTFKNESQPADIYIWVLKYKDSLTGTLMQKNGTVMLMR